MRACTGLFILLLLVQASWAPTCGGGPTGSQYHFGDPQNLGLPYPADQDATIDIYDLDNDSAISVGYGYYCKSGKDCYTFAKVYQRIPGTKVLLQVDHDGYKEEYIGYLRYAGFGGLDNCGGPVYWIDLIVPKAWEGLYILLIALPLAVLAILKLKGWFPFDKGKTRGRYGGFDWKRLGLSLILLKFTEWIARILFDIAGICVGQGYAEFNEYGAKCLSSTLGLQIFAPVAILVFLMVSLIIPVTGCFVATLYYFRRNPMKRLPDAAAFLFLFACLAVAFSWTVSIGQHLLTDTGPLLGANAPINLALYIIVVITAFLIISGVDLAVYAFAMAVGGGLVYLLLRPK